MKVSCCKHNEIQKLYIYKAATTIGWWGILVVIARSAKLIQAAARSLTSVPIF
jgi:hypothetical protein